MIKNTWRKYAMMGALVCGLSFGSVQVAFASEATQSEQGNTESKESKESTESKESKESNESNENKPAYTVTSMSGTYYATDDATVYSEPSNSASNLGTVKKEASVSVTGATNNDSTSWYQISFNGNNGFVKQNLFTTTAPVSQPSYTVADSTMTLYALSDTPVYVEPDTTGNVLGTLKANESVAGTGTTVTAGFSWWRVTFNGKVGYVFSNYVTSNAPVTAEPENSDVSSNENSVLVSPDAGYTLDPSVAGTYQTTSSINVRSTPSKSADNKIGTLDEGAQITVLAFTKTSEGSWYQIQFGNQLGFVAADYVTTSNQKTENPGGTIMNDENGIINETTDETFTDNALGNDNTPSKPSTNKSKKTLIIVVAIILIMLVIGGTVFYLLHGNGEDDENMEDADLEGDNFSDSEENAVEYDEYGNPIEYDENGYLIEYDADGKRIYYDEATGEPYVLTDEEAVEYDEFGNPIEYDEYGNPIEYDANGRIIYYDENGDPYVLTDEE